MKMERDAARALLPLLDEDAAKVFEAAQDEDPAAALGIAAVMSMAISFRRLADTLSRYLPRV